MNFQLPLIERDIWANAKVEHRKIVDLSLARRQAVGGPHCRLRLARHLERPTLFGSDVLVFHSKQVSGGGSRVSSVEWQRESSAGAPEAPTPRHPTLDT